MNLDGKTMVEELQQIPTNKFITGADVNSYRDTLVEKYRGKHKGILQKIKSSTGVSSDEILVSIVEEILLESEDLLGTRLMFSEEGSLHDAASVTVKRSDLLKSVADIVTKRKELNQRASDIDLNSPAFMVFQKLCFDKMIAALSDLNIDDEMIQLVLSKWSKQMEDWGKELKNKLEEMTQ